MLCDDFDDRLQKVLDLRSPPAKDAALRAHGLVCDRCQAHLNATERLLSGLRPPRAVPDLPPSFAERAVAAAKSPGTSQPQPAPAGRLIFGAVLALAASWLVILLPAARRQVDPEEPTQVAVERSAQVSGVSHVEQPPRVSNELAAEHDDMHVAPRLANNRSGLPADDYGQFLQLWILSVYHESLTENEFDQIASGLRPLATTLNVALDALRRTWPGQQAGPSRSSSDSASKRVPLLVS